MEKLTISELTTPQNSTELAKFCSVAAKDRLGKDVVIMDMTNIDTAVTDHFVIITSESEPQAEAIVNKILELCREYDIQKPKLEGLDYKDWILLDFFDVVVHIMLPKVRRFYNIEKLWGDAKFIVLNDNNEFAEMSDVEILQLLKETV